MAHASFSFSSISNEQLKDLITKKTINYAWSSEETDEILPETFFGCETRSSGPDCQYSEDVMAKRYPYIFEFFKKVDAKGGITI